MTMWSVLEASEDRKKTCGDSKGVVKLVTYFSEEIEMSDGSRSGVHQDILFGIKLS